MRVVVVIVARVSSERLPRCDEDVWVGPCFDSNGPRGNVRDDFIYGRFTFGAERTRAQQRRSQASLIYMATAGWVIRFIDWVLEGAFGVQMF